MLFSDHIIVFIRHGQADYHASDIDRPLSSVGILQAKERALFLKDCAFDGVITSSALRTKQTAQCIIETLNISPVVVELDELYQPKDIEDRNNVNYLLEKLGSSSLDKYLNQDKDSSWEKYSKDAFQALQHSVMKLNVKRILVVAHGNIINSIGLCINPLAQSLLEIYFSYCEGFKLINLELSILNAQRTER